MNNLFKIAESCLYQSDIQVILNLTHQAKNNLVRKTLSFARNGDMRPIESVVFPDKPILLEPRQMPKRKLTTQDGVIAFFHAIAHVEFMAIYLAWDIIYRFPDLPQAFYQDWLTVADEEAQHFELIRDHLQSMGIDYGDLPAHGGLWDHAVATADDLLGRLAMVPRCMEARGLDVTPAIIAKFKVQNDQTAVAILTRILTDEVKHVEYGSIWFKTLCRLQGKNSEQYYQDMISRYYLGGKPKGPFNRTLRRQAGFSESELDWLEQG
jgi:uncharacterized ferritin-like protein (DUF455 family)